MTYYHLFLGSLSVLGLVLLVATVGPFGDMVLHFGKSKRSKALNAAAKSDFTPFKEAECPDTTLIRTLQLAEAVGRRSRSTVRLQILDAQQVLVDAGWDTKLVTIGEPTIYIVVARKATRIETVVYRSE